MLRGVGVFLIAFSAISSVPLNPPRKFIGADPEIIRVPRNLVIKSYPAVENYQSDLYEVIMEPYVFNSGVYSAIAMFKDCENAIKGEVFFYQSEPPGGPVMISGNITGLPSGKHGIHIHRSGYMREGCEKLGEHYNPYMMQHGGPMDPLRHAGDLGNIEVTEGAERTEFTFIDPIISLVGARSIVGRSIVITEEMDDLGRGGTAESFTTGSTSKPIACAAITYIR
ncbi:superoxide dismutase [Cu-Zn]-like [Onthophagus taurus]|uniref:superoxide dismutase [Cu-Zn]-like n=1 Tax=Onthophagus taurus TaxID=166361 RepID=UPI0039BEC2C8